MSRKRKDWREMTVEGGGEGDDGEFGMEGKRN